MTAEVQDLGINEYAAGDEAAALMNMRNGFTDYGKQEHNTIIFRGGTVLSSNNRWIFCFYWLKIVGNGVTFRAITDSKDEMMNRPLSQGELLQKNVLDYIGTKLYKKADRFGDVKAGSNKIPLLSNEGKYKAGDRILLYQGNIFNGGYPPPDKECEVKEIESIDEAGFVYTTFPVEHNYINNQYDNANIDGDGCGRPRMINLDDPNNLYPQHLEIEDVNFGRSTSDQPGNVALRANNLILRRCKIDKDSYLWPTESQRILIEDCDTGPIEFDKLSRYAKLDNVRSAGAITNGGAFERIEIVNSFTGPVSLCPRELEIRKTHIRSNGDIDIFLPALSCYAAKNPMRRVTLDRLTFSSEPESYTDSHISIAPILFMAIHDVRGKDILTTDFDIVKTMEAGTTVLFEESAKDGGLITSITHDGENFVISGDWNSAPRLGDVWKWEVVKEVIDRGGHQVKDNKSLYHPDSRRWQGNTSTGPIKETILTERDFMWKPGGNTSVIMDFSRFIESVDFYMSKPCGGSGAMINIKDHDDVELLAVNTKTCRTDYFDSHEWAKKLSLNSFNVSSDMRDDLLPRFTIVIRSRQF